MIKKNIVTLLFTLIFLINVSPVLATCPSGYTSYGDAFNCATKCSTSCAGDDGECCATFSSCPENTSDFGSTTRCATGCSTSCVGPESRCCTIDPDYVPTTEPGGIHAPEPVTKDVIDQLNPLIQNQDPSAEAGLAKKLSTPGGIISRFLGKFAFPIAGFILFLMLIWGGIEMMAGSATSKSIDAGKQRVTTAIGGFLLLFASFWIARILELMFGIKIL